MVIYNVELCVHHGHLLDCNISRLFHTQMEQISGLHSRAFGSGLACKYYIRVEVAAETSALLACNYTVITCNVL